jgi:hypothetical protein
MWNPLRRSQKRTLTTRPKLGRLGVTGLFAVAALFVIFVAGWILDRRGASEADQRLAKLAQAAKEPPLDLIERAARSNRIVMISDIHNSAAVKQFVAQAIARVATTSGLDAVILEIGADQQGYIDQYFDRAPEDASVLMSHPRTLREPGAATRAYLEIYHTIWTINQKLGPDERIRVIAADVEGSGAGDVQSPAEAAKWLSDRAEFMEQMIQQRVLSTIPTARILVFMTGFNVLKHGEIALQTGGSVPVNVTPLAKRLSGSTDEAYSVIVDAPSGGTTGRQVAPYVGTRVADILRELGVRKTFGVLITSEFDYLKQPLIERKAPGMEFSITPRDYKLRDVADAYINLN